MGKGVYNASHKMIIGGYPAESYSIWNNESFLSVIWKPEAYDSLIPHRYPPVMENATMMKVEIEFDLKRNEIN